MISHLDLFELFALINGVTCLGPNSAWRSTKDGPYLSVAVLAAAYCVSWNLWTVGLGPTDFNFFRASFFPARLCLDDVY